MANYHPCIITLSIIILLLSLCPVFIMSVEPKFE
jgi:hypothetical protein